VGVVGGPTTSLLCTKLCMNWKPGDGLSLLLFYIKKTLILIRAFCDDFIGSEGTQ
jgi:hypothetical protein